jgi:hypothetical protein
MSSHNQLKVRGMLAPHLLLEMTWDILEQMAAGFYEELTGKRGDKD